MIPWRARQALFLLMAVFVAAVQGPGSPYWLWNCAPIAVSYLLLKHFREKDENPLPAIAFFVLACGTVLVAHAAWLDSPAGVPDPGSGFGPAALPVYALLLGGAAFGVCHVLLRSADG